MTLLSDNARPRIVGHGRTLWIWNGVIIAWVERMVHTPPSPLAQAVDVTPLNYVRPIVIAPPRAISRGEITMEITETYEGRAWDVLARAGGGDSMFPDANHGGPHDLADVFHAFQSSGTAPNLIRVLRPPTRGSKPTEIQVDQFHGVEILDVQDGEDASAEAMTNTVTITVGYTHRQRWKNDKSSASGYHEKNPNQINNKVY